jgi:uncharacterized protein
VKVTGSATLHAPPARVWAALTDPAVLAAAIPGCQRFEPAGQDAYRFTIAAGLASLQGVYQGQVALSEQARPSSFLLTANGAGAPGTVAVSIRFRLADADAARDDGGFTDLGYDADGEVTGLLAAAGQRLVAAVAQQLAADFFRSVDGQLTAPAPAGGSGPEAAPGTEAGDPDAASQPSPAAPPPPATTPRAIDPAFVGGVLAGTAATLAGVALGRVLRRAGLGGRPPGTPRGKT